MPSLLAHTVKLLTDIRHTSILGGDDYTENLLHSKAKFCFLRFFSYLCSFGRKQQLVGNLSCHGNVLRRQFFRLGGQNLSVGCSSLQILLASQLREDRQFLLFVSTWAKHRLHVHISTSLQQ